ALPFIWVGLALTVRRLRDAGLPLGLVLLFFVPFVNLVVFLILSVAPPQPERARAAEPPPERFGRLREAHRKITRESSVTSGLVAVLVGAVLAVAAAVISVQVLA